jgi:hypothetical protein
MTDIETDALLKLMRVLPKCQQCMYIRGSTRRTVIYLQFFFFDLNREVYSNKGIRWAVSQQASCSIRFVILVPDYTEY